MLKKILPLTILLLIMTSSSIAYPYELRTNIERIKNSELKENITESIKQLRTRLQTQKEISDRDIRQLIASQVKSATSAFGYFSPLIRIKKRKNVLTVSIRLNDPTYVSKVSIKVTGDKNNIEIKKKLKQLPRVKKKILNTNDYLKIKNSLYKTALENGFFKAKFIKSKIILSNHKKNAEINIIFNTGPRFRINQTRILDKSLDKEIIIKMLHFKKGDYYTAKKILASQQAILESGYYQQAIITPEFYKSRQARVNIRVQLIPIEKKEYKIALGYGTNTGIRTSAKFSNNFMNNQGHRLSIKSQISKISQNIGASYIIPGKKLNRDFYSIDTAYTQFQINNKPDNSKAVRVSASKVIQNKRWRQVYSLVALNEKYRLSTTTTAKLLYPIATLTYKKADRDLNPDNGYSANISIAGTPKAFSSKSNFLQLKLSGKYLHTFEKTHSRILARTNIAITNISSLNNLPLSLQLFVGGTESIRGYSYDEIGPGKNLFTMSTELQQKIYNSLYAVLFHDAGDVTNTDEFIKTTYGSTGVGVAWLSPIGTLELTAAKPKTKKSKWVFQFSMGSFL